jgi:hypothetical protein
VIWDNDMLQTLEGLGPITQLFSRLWIDTNPNLTSLAGLNVSSGSAGRGGRPPAAAVSSPVSSNSCASARAPVGSPPLARFCSEKRGGSDATRQRGNPLLVYQGQCAQHPSSSQTTARHTAAPPPSP